MACRGTIPADWRCPVSTDLVTCTNCGATFEGDEFCPECGQWVDHAEEHFSLDESASTGEVSSVPYTTVTCPSCGAPNPESNRHCEECGARLYQGDLPVAPQPLITMTAGVRAAIVIGSVIVGVIIIALVFNAIRGDGGDTTTESTETSTTTTLQRTLPERIPASNISVECSSELASFPCENLIDGTDAAWNDAGLEGVGATMTFTFNTPWQLEQIVFNNLEDDTRFRRNFRINGLEIRADDMTDGTIETLVNRAGRHLINFTTLNTTQVVIEVRSTWPAEVVDGTSFTELALEEVEFYGRPAG